MDKIRKLFGGIDLTWPKLIIFAVIAGVYTALMALIPQLADTSFHTIAVTLEVWILFGIIIIMNSKSNLDSALKCFVFFLISQPLVYLIQVPFSEYGFGLFIYYKYWFILTVLCFPMGFIGYYMKKGKWWGYIILFPMIIVTAYSYYQYLGDFMFSTPRYILISLFCIAAMILYPLVIFEDKKIQKIGAAISVAVIIAATVLCIMRPQVYNTDLFSSGDDDLFDDTYSVYLDDPKYGDVSIRYEEAIECYLIHADFRHAGTTTLTLESPSGEKTVYDLKIERSRYEIEERS